MIYSITNLTQKPTDIMESITRTSVAKRIILFTAAGTLVLLLCVIASFLVPRHITFAFDRENCVTNPLVLPHLIVPEHSTAYTVMPRPSLSIAGYPVYSQRTCLTMTAASTTTETPRLRSRVLPFMRLQLRVVTGTLPIVSNANQLTGPISTREPLIFRLDSADRVHAYRLRAGSVSAPCRNTDSRTVACDPTPLSLAHATPYDFRLERNLRGKAAGEAFAKRLPTVNAITIDSASIAAGTTVFDVPKAISFTLNRPASQHAEITLYRLSGIERQPLPATVTLAGTALTVNFNQPLPRNAVIGVSVGTLTAPDGGYLVQPYGLEFRTSGGPKVLGISIGEFKVQLTNGLRLNFDTAIEPAQLLQDRIRLEVGGQAVPARIKADGSGINLVPQNNLPACTSFTVRVLDGLQNGHGVSGNSAWQFSSRTICQTVFSIGTSVQGRAIAAYRFGTGSSRIIMIGATHGDERSSATLLSRYIDHLEANPSLIPAHRSVTIIPILNPDAYAANKRTNARDVDLNRNFAAINWKSSVTMPNKSVLPTGGGTAPLSEPESAAIASFINAESPRLVLTFHATGGVVIPNDSGDSVALARAYADRSKVYFANNAATGTLFAYDTTGAMEDWLHDGPGIPALLIELHSFNGNEFTGQQNALRYVTALP